MAIIEGNYVHFDEHPENLLSNLHQLYFCNMFVDMCMVCQGREVFAHKAVIAAASPILRDKIIEFGDCHARIDVEYEVSGLDLNAEDVKLLVEFIYKGQVCVPESRLSLFLEVGNHFQVFGLFRQAPNFGTQLPFLSQPLSNYNITQHTLPNINIGGLQQQENISYEETSSLQNNYEGPSFPGLFPPSTIMSPEKLSDNPIKQDKSVAVPVSNTSFSDLCSSVNTIEPFLIRDRNLHFDVDEGNPKSAYEYQPFTNINDPSLQDLSKLPLCQGSSFQSDLSESSVQIQSEHSKDVFEERTSLSSTGPADQDILISDLTSQTNTYFSSENLEDVNTDQSCITDISFQACKIPPSSSFPERQMRLKVKDSIGGVSLQDTSQGEKGTQKNLPEMKEINFSVESSCFAVQDDLNTVIILEDTVEPEESEPEPDNSCTECQKSFLSIDDLTNHLYEEHNIGTLHKCLICSFKTLMENHLVEHGRTHLGSSDRQCCICGKRFKTRATLRNHLSCHASNKWFKCKECNAHYSQKNNLIKHLASKHRLNMEGEPIKEPFSCTFCSFVTWAPHKLKNHKVRCHTEDKPFKCSQCSYSATERTSLVKHVRTHTQERPYICDFCGLSFVTVSSLKRHCRGHTKEKPFKCKDCGQQYADKKRLKDHYLKHKSIKPFKCTACQYSCRRKDNLQSHIKRNHANSTVEEVLLEEPYKTPS